MPRPMQVLTFRDFLGEYDGNPIEGAQQQASVLQNLYLTPGQRGLRRRGGTVPLGLADLTEGIIEEN